MAACQCGFALTCFCRHMNARTALLRPTAAAGVDPSDLLYYSYTNVAGK